MKKKVLAVVLAAAMVSGTCMPAMADDEMKHSGDHGTEDGAVVSTGETGEDTMNAADPSGQTHIYMAIDENATSGQPIAIPGTDIVAATTAGVCHFEVLKETTKQENLSVTIPLYVCMYGYGGDGKVVAPDGDAYKMVNDSTYSESRTVKKIYKCYGVIPILSIDKYVTDEARADYVTAKQKAFEEENQSKMDAAAYKEALAKAKETFTAESADDDKVYEAYIKSIVGDSDASQISTLESGQYGYYTTYEADPDDSAKQVATNTTIELSKCEDNKKNSTCTNTNKYDYIYRVEATETDGDDTDKISVNDSETIADRAYLPVNIPTIETESYWNIKPASDLDQLGAGDIVMSINDLDLSEVVDNGNTLDILDRGWFIGTDVDDDNEHSLSLPITAAIAGGSVNKDKECVPVVRVTYTVAPAYERLSNTTTSGSNATAGGSDSSSGTTT
jgi:hypothetical protein